MKFRQQPPYWARDGSVVRAFALTNVARVQFPVPVSYVGWVCCWFLSLLRGFFSGFSSFPPSTKTNISKFDLESVDEEALCGDATANSNSNSNSNFNFQFPTSNFQFQIRRQISSNKPFYAGVGVGLLLKASPGAKLFNGHAVYEYEFMCRWIKKLYSCEIICTRPWLEKEPKYNLKTFYTQGAIHQYWAITRQFLCRNACKTVKEIRARTCSCPYVNVGHKIIKLQLYFQTIDSTVVRDNLRVLLKQFYGLTIALDEVRICIIKFCLYNACADWLLCRSVWGYIN